MFGEENFGRIISHTVLAYVANFNFFRTITARPAFGAYTFVRVAFVFALAKLARVVFAVVFQYFASIARVTFRTLAAYFVCLIVVHAPAAVFALVFVIDHRSSDFAKVQPVNFHIKKRINTFF